MLKPLTFHCEPSHDDCRGDDMALVIFSIDLACARQIVQRSHLVRSLGLLKISASDYRAYWFDEHPVEVASEDGRAPLHVSEGAEFATYLSDPLNLLALGAEEASTDNNLLNVYGRDFTFTCTRQGLSDTVSTGLVGIGSLAAHFGLPWAFKGAEEYLNAKFGDAEDSRFPHTQYEEEGAVRSYPRGYSQFLLAKYDAAGIEVSWLKPREDDLKGEIESVLKRAA